MSAVAINCLGKYGQYEFYFSTVKVFTIVALSLSSNPVRISIMLTKFDYPSHHRYSDRQPALEDGEYYPTPVVVMYTSGIRPDSHKSEHWSQIFDVSWCFCTVQRYPRSDRKDPWHLVRFDAGDYRSLFYRTLEYFKLVQKAIFSYCGSEVYIDCFLDYARTTDTRRSHQIPAIAGAEVRTATISNLLINNA